MPIGTVIQGSFRGGAPRLPAPTHPSVAQGRPGRTAEPAPLLPRALAGSMGLGGQPLPPAVQQKMEAAFGTSFADVRVHVGREAPEIGALAFTCGSHLYFAPGQYDPQTPHGQRLLGHELTHVVQQRAGRVRNPFGSGIAIVQDPGLEAEAERMGLRAASLPVPPGPARQSAEPPRPTAPRPALARGQGSLQCRPVPLRNPAKEDREYLALIEDYEKLQRFLTDRHYFLPALEALNAEVEAQIRTHGRKRALSTVLLRREQQYGINSQGAPIYTSGLSGPDFNRMLQEAVIPKDVGELPRHGEQTHRIQWYVILWNMYGGFKTTNHQSRGFNFSARELLIRSTKVQVPKKNFPRLLDRGANVWHALFDMAMDVPFSEEYVSNEHDWREDVLTSADLLGGALHGAESHMANRLLERDHGWVATGRALREAAPTVSGLLAKNYAKRLEEEGRPGNHLEDYHRKKLESGWYREPAWSTGGILLPNQSWSLPASFTVKQVVERRIKVPRNHRDFNPAYLTFLEHLLFNARWDREGTGFLGFGTKTPDGVAKMRAACREHRTWDVFRIAEAKLGTEDSNRTSLVRDLYEALVGIWNSPWHTFNSRVREVGRWDISRR